jgi:hypothetical protein
MKSFNSKIKIKNQFLKQEENIKSKIIKFKIKKNQIK